jgi:hypothetical protein
MITDPLPSPTLAGANGGAISVSYGFTVNEWPEFLRLTSKNEVAQPHLTISIDLRVAAAKRLRDALNAFISRNE